MSRSSRLLAILSAIALFLVPATVGAQGVLVVVDPNVAVRLPRPIVIHPPHVRPEPIPPASYQIQELDVQARIVDQVAQVQVSQSFVNTGSRVLEVSFLFPLPYDGAVEQMTLLVDGKEHPARLLKADEARRLYEEIVRKNRDPALLEWMGTGLFRTSVFPVPPGQKRTVSLRYSQLCRKQEGLTDFLFPLSTAKYTAKPVEKVQLRVTIESQTAIKNVYSPSHAVEIQRPSDRHATVTYTLKNEVPTSDFRLLYDVGQGKVSARVLSYRPSRSGDAEGYFLLLASPEIKKGDGELRKKTVVFVIDRSGSMSGKKIEQVRGALKFVLENLRKGDLFNIVAYDSQVESFRPELQRFDKQTRQAALGFVEGLYAGGSTNIEGALRTALDQLQDSGQPNFVVFLTDGLPTTGVTQEGAIAQSATRANRVRARLFTFGVGYDVNSRLLDKLARENHGSTEYVRPNEDIEDRVSRLYRRIGAPVMTDVKLEFSLDEHRQGAGSPTSRVYPKGAIDLFAGDQLAVVGRYRTGGEAKVVVSGSVSGRTEKFDFPARLVAESGDETNAFIEKLWAARRVGEILEEIDARGKNDELIRELVELSTRHGILTPYTSFLADENTRLGDLAGNATRTRDRLEALSETSGALGVGQRAYRIQLQKANVAASAQTDAAYRFQSEPSGTGGAAGPSSYAMKSAGRPSAAMTPGASGMPGSVTTTPLSASLATAEGEMADAPQNVQQVGNKTFYRRNNQWVDAAVTEEQQKRAVRVQQFSDRYFELARRHGRTLSQYLAFDEPVVVNLEDQAYLIEP